VSIVQVILLLFRTPFGDSSQVASAVKEMTMGSASMPRSNA
jgi:hypothetical protein